MTPSPLTDSVSHSPQGMLSPIPLNSSVHQVENYSDYLKNLEGEGHLSREESELIQLAVTHERDIHLLQQAGQKLNELIHSHDKIKKEAGGITLSDRIEEIGQGIKSQKYNDETRCFKTVMQQTSKDYPLSNVPKATASIQRYNQEINALDVADSQFEEKYQAILKKALPVLAEASLLIFIAIMYTQSFGAIVAAMYGDHREKHVDKNAVSENKESKNEDIQLTDSQKNSTQNDISIETLNTVRLDFIESSNKKLQERIDWKQKENLNLTPRQREKSRKKENDEIGSSHEPLNNQVPAPLPQSNRSQSSKYSEPFPAAPEIEQHVPFKIDNLNHRINRNTLLRSSSDSILGNRSISTQRPKLSRKGSGLYINTSLNPNQNGRSSQNSMKNLSFEIEGDEPIVTSPSSDSASDIVGQSKIKNKIYPFDSNLENTNLHAYIYFLEENINSLERGIEEMHLDLKAAQAYQPQKSIQKTDSEEGSSSHDGDESDESDSISEADSTSSSTETSSQYTMEPEGENQINQNVIELENLKLQVQNFEKEREHKDQKINQLENTIADNISRIIDLESSLTSNTEKSNQNLERINALKENLNDLQKEHSNYLVELKSLQTQELETYRDQLEQKTKEKEDLHHQTQKFQAEIKTKNQTLDELKGQIQAFKLQQTQFEEKVAELESLKNFQIQNLEKYHNQLEKNQKEQEIFQSKIEKLEVNLREKDLELKNRDKIIKNRDTTIKLNREMAQEQEMEYTDDKNRLEIELRKIIEENENLSKNQEILLEHISENNKFIKENKKNIDKISNLTRINNELKEKIKILSGEIIKENGKSSQKKSVNLNKQPVTQDENQDELTKFDATSTSKKSQVNQIKNLEKENVELKTKLEFYEAENKALRDKVSNMKKQLNLSYTFETNETTGEIIPMPITTPFKAKKTPWKNWEE